MSLSHCARCWDTPCTCNDGSGYKHLSLNELLDIKRGIDRLIADKVDRAVDPNKREHDLKT